MTTSKKISSRAACALLATVLSLGTTPAWSGAGSPGHGHGAAPAQDHMMGGQGMPGQMMGGQGMPGHHGAAPAIGGPGKAADVTRAIDITMHDNFYEPAEIAVKAGETVRFKIANKGTLLHEFGLGGDYLDIPQGGDAGVRLQRSRPLRVRDDGAHQDQMTRNREGAIP